MRVVNSIEREMMSVEWDDWRRGERERCQRMEGILAKSDDGRVGEREREAFEAYCGSCWEGEGGFDKDDTLGAGV